MSNIYVAVWTSSIKVQDICETTTLFLYLFLHQITTQSIRDHHAIKLFLYLFLHQTTTISIPLRKDERCSFICFYIKPQLWYKNSSLLRCCSCICFYIKPQPWLMGKNCWWCCSFICFYIKPQPLARSRLTSEVVLVFVSTSNHNLPTPNYSVWLVVLVFVSTSNHNLISLIISSAIVVLVFVSTSNHNSLVISPAMLALFLYLFLHQTTTSGQQVGRHCRCSCICFYIKPQLKIIYNLGGNGCSCICFYIKPQPLFIVSLSFVCCSCICFYIKPQLLRAAGSLRAGCSCICFYIKPQPFRFSFS